MTTALTWKRLVPLIVNPEPGPTVFGDSFLIVCFLGPTVSVIDSSTGREHIRVHCAAVDPHLPDAGGHRLLGPFLEQDVLAQRF